VNDSENLRGEPVLNKRDPNTRGSSVFDDKFLLDQHLPVKRTTNQGNGCNVHNDSRPLKCNFAHDGSSYCIPEVYYQ